MKQRNISAHLYDILQAADLLNEFATGTSLNDYARDARLRSGVER